MTIKKLLLFTFLTILTSFIFTTAFFNFEHKVQSEKYEINKQIHFDEYSVFIKNIEVYNFNKRSRYSSTSLNTLSFQPSLAEKILHSNLNPKLLLKLRKIFYFYSSPYQVTEDSYNIDIDYEVILDQNISYTKNEKYEISNAAYISILLEGDSNYTKTPSSLTRVRDNTNVLTKTDSLESSSKSIKAIMLNVDEVAKSNVTQHVVSLDSPPIIVKYDFFNRKVFP